MENAEWEMLVWVLITIFLGLARLDLRGSGMKMIDIRSFAYTMIDRRTTMTTTLPTLELKYFLK